MDSETEDCKMKSMRKPTVNDIPQWLTTIPVVFFITGSTRFMCAGIGSDLDIAVTIMDRSRVLDAAKKSENLVVPSEYNCGFKVDDGSGVIVNIVALHPLDFCSWARAATMAEASGIFKGVSQKTRRLAIHEMLVATAKMSFAQGEAISPKNFQENAGKLLFSLDFRKEV